MSDIWKYAKTGGLFLFRFCGGSFPLFPFWESVLRTIQKPFYIFPVHKDNSHTHQNRKNQINIKCFPTKEEHKNRKEYGCQKRPKRNDPCNKDKRDYHCGEY